MIKLLLDFPWSIDASLDPDPLPLQVIRDFLNLLVHVPLEPVRFVYENEKALFYQRLPSSRGRWVADVLRFLNHVAAEGQGGQYRAIPLNGPNDVRQPWEIALRDEMGDTSNWRTPHIVVCAERAQEWGQCIQDHEAEIILEDQPNDRPHRRVAVIMQSYDYRQASRYKEDYRNHQYALADVDPWDLRRKHPPVVGNRVDYPARLPKPPELESTRLVMPTEIDESRRLGWQRGDRFYYIPPETWRATQVDSRDEWRAGAFPESRARNGRGPGPLDFLGQVWDWDLIERHWDVQLTNGTYMRITHEGVWRR